jgi:release factor glutamine methyltransferase
VTTVAHLLRACGLPRAEAQALLAHLLGTGREQLVAHPQRAVDAGRARDFAALAERRRGGEPLAYLLGQREFYGRRFAVTPAVLIPRPETELLVEVGLESIAALSEPAVLELGAGCGCVAITLALQRSAARVTAVERSPEALALARANALALGATLRWIEGDWFERVDGVFDLIVANPPYVRTGDPHLADLAFEPAAALVSGADGLDDLRRIVAGAPAHLRPGGWLAVEHGYDQAGAVAALFAAAGFERIACRRDLQRHPRVSCGRRRADSG